MAQQDTARQVDREARSSTTLEWAVRIGLLAYALVHLLVTLVAVRLVTGRSPHAATGKGALAQLADNSLGKAVLIAMAICFAALAVWQLIAGLVGYRDRSGWMRHLNRLAAGGRVLTYGYFALASARLAFTGPSTKSPDSMTARVMAAPGGVFVVVAAGLVAISIGVGLVVFGLRKQFLGQLDEKARNADRRIPIVVIGQVGYVVKGLAFVVVGLLLDWAAFTHDPNKSGGLDQALHELLGRSLGGPAVLVVGAGIGLYGIYLLARSRHLSENSLTS